MWVLDHDSDKSTCAPCKPAVGLSGVFSLDPVIPGRSNHPHPMSSRPNEVSGGTCIPSSPTRVPHVRQSGRGIAPHSPFLCHPDRRGEAAQRRDPQSPPQESLFLKRRHSEPQSGEESRRCPKPRHRRKFLPPPASPGAWCPIQARCWLEWVMTLSSCWVPHVRPFGRGIAPPPPSPSPVVIPPKSATLNSCHPDRTK